MPRSILTEKLGRRGYHLSCEYGVDPLEMICVEEVMTEVPEPLQSRAGQKTPHQLPDVLAYTDETCRDVAEEMATTGITRMPVLDRKTGLVCGIVTAHNLLAGRKCAVGGESDRNREFQFESLIR